MGDPEREHNYNLVFRINAEYCIIGFDFYFLLLVVKYLQE